MTSKETPLVYGYDGEHRLGLMLSGDIPTDYVQFDARGFRGVATYVSKKAAMQHELFRKDDEFILVVQLDPYSHELFYARNIPDYIRLVREVLNPLLACSAYAEE